MSFKKTLLTAKCREEVFEEGKSLIRLDKVFGFRFARLKIHQTVTEANFFSVGISNISVETFVCE